MASIFDMLTRQQPQFVTRQALLVLGLQNDFISPDGKLPQTNGQQVLERINKLVPAFRASGDIFWIRTENRSPLKPKRRQDANSVILSSDESSPRPADDQSTSDRVDSTLGYDESVAKDLKSADTRESAHKTTKTADPELFLEQLDTESRCCDPASTGAQYVTDVQRLQAPGDPHLVKSEYSAFSGTSLLFTLRTRMVTEIYLVGCMTNVCIYATAVDAACHGIQINIIEDCLGYRTLHRHTDAINRMVEDTGASVTTSATVMSRFEPGRESANPETREASPDLVECLNDTDPDNAPLSFPSSTRNPNSSTMATRPTSSEYQLQPIEAPQADIVVPEYVASSCALGERASAMQVDKVVTPDDETREPIPVFQNMAAIRSIDRVDTQARTEEWRKSCSPVQDPAEGLDAQGADRPDSLPAQHTPEVGQKQATPESSEGRTSKKRRSTEIDGVDPVPDPHHTQDERPASAPPQHSTQQPVHKKSKHLLSLANLPGKLPGDTIGRGDTTMSYDLLSRPDADKAFNTLLNEVSWQRMTHVTSEVPRLVCCQGTFLRDGAMPIYRHPSDSTLPLLHWTPTVDRIRRLAEQHVGHELNHALVQLYRSGHDHISEHSDKTLDMMPGSQIVNVSLGAQRTMRLRSKRAKQSPCVPGPVQQPESTNPSRLTQRIPMPHASLLSMGLDTNAHFLHGIQPDRRLDHDLSGPEQAYGGMRISLTFRHIGTFIDARETKIWGVGATAQSEADAAAVQNGDDDNNDVEGAHNRGGGGGGGVEAARDLLGAFGRENQGSGLRREEVYGPGSDVVHLKLSPPRGRPMVFLSGHGDRDGAVAHAFRHAVDGGRGGEVSMQLPIDLGLESLAERGFCDADGRRLVEVPESVGEVVYVDADKGRTEVRGWVAVLAYLDALRSREQAGGGRSGQELARTAELFAGLASFEQCMDEGRERHIAKVLVGLERGREMRDEDGEVGLAGGAGASPVDFGYWALIKKALSVGIEERERETSSLPRLGQWVAGMDRLIGEPTGSRHLASF